MYFGDFTDFCFSVFFGGSAITNAEAMQIWRYGAFCWMRRMGYINNLICGLVAAPLVLQQNHSAAAKAEQIIVFEASDSDWC